MNRLSVWGKGEKIARREKGKGFPSPFSRFFHPIPKQRACSEATERLVLVSSLSSRQDKVVFVDDHVV